VLKQATINTRIEYDLTFDNNVIINLIFFNKNINFLLKIYEQYTVSKQLRKYPTGKCLGEDEVRAITNTV
jgi:hypothetical protein